MNKIYTIEDTRRTIEERFDEEKEWNEGSNNVK